MFLYFVSTTTNRFGDAELDEFGLRYAIDAPKIGQVRTGPDGKPGVVVVDRDSMISPKYLPDVQTWRQRFGDARVWVGYQGDTPPRPLSLARTRQLPGAPVRLSDGTRLMVPHARRWVEVEERLLWSIALPQALQRDEEGQWIPGDVVTQYRRLWELLSEFLDAREAAIRDADVDNGESVYFTFDGMDELVIAAITANYRIGPDELEILGCYDQRVRDQVLDVLMDESTREAWLKKKLAALTAGGGSSSAGLEPSTGESTPGTGQPSPTSGPGAKECTKGNDTAGNLGG